jgi:hypothetical protein
MLTLYFPFVFFCLLTVTMSLWVMFLQIAQHKLLGIQMVARSLGWFIISVNHSVGVGDLEPTGNASGVMIGSPHHDR